MTLEILGIGTAVPDHAIEQSDAAEQVVQVCCETAEQDRLIKALYRRAGVRKRHIAVLESGTNGAPAQQSFYSRSQMPSGPTTADRMRAYETYGGPLALRAAQAALDHAAVLPSEITHLVTVSCSGFSAPGIDISLIQGLGLPDSVSRTNVGFMGCHGALNGLRVADAYASADDACVLVCALELCSLHHQYQWDHEQIVANALFSDGAAALVGRRAAANRPIWKLVDQRSAVIPETTDLMSWRVSDHGFQMTLSSQLPLLIEKTLGPWVEAWLAPHGTSIAKVGSWAIHPGGPRILDACTTALGLETHRLDHCRKVLAEYGNMSSPTLLFILEQLIEQAAPRPCVALAFGPGIAIEAALFE
jgi:predicted naringenin-chalcone synthase